MRWWGVIGVVRFRGGLVWDCILDRLILGQIVRFWLVLLLPVPAGQLWAYAQQSD
jgi:hypothetical protein